MREESRAEEFLSNLTRRPRRNRKSPGIRSLLQETKLHPSDLVWPLFVREGKGRREALPSIEGNYRLSPDSLLLEVERAHREGICAFMLFPFVEKELKNPLGSEALNPDNLINSTIRLLKKELPDICVIADIALDPYTTHGHDGLLDKRGGIDNDASVRVLSDMAIAAAASGVDIIAPSDMMDGRIGYIRRALDRQKFLETSILSYTAKYASAFYGPFRDVLASTPAFGDKKTYQMDPANSREALLECSLDEKEGADLLLIKPALPYLDVISKVRESTHLPVGGYHVSGEYAMIMAAAAAGYLNADIAFLESFTSIKRAGANFIVTYAAPMIAKLL